jgi:hypothetical protein
MSAYSFSVHQEQEFNKMLCASERIAKCHRVAGVWGGEDTQGAHGIRRWQVPKLEIDMFADQKILLVVIDKLFYGAVSETGKKIMCFCSFMRNR